MKTVLLFIGLFVLAGCLSDDTFDDYAAEVAASAPKCEKTIIHIGLPEQMKQEGLKWFLSMDVNQPQYLEGCYKLTRKSAKVYEAEIIC